MSKSHFDGGVPRHMWDEAYSLGAVRHKLERQHLRQTGQDCR